MGISVVPDNRRLFGPMTVLEILKSGAYVRRKAKMDEPFMRLYPRLVEQSFDMIKLLSEQGDSILMVAQNANMALSIADRGYVLQTGNIVLEGSASELAGHQELRRAYLGR